MAQQYEILGVKFTVGIEIVRSQAKKTLPPDPARHQDSARQYYLLSGDDF